MQVTTTRRAPERVPEPRLLLPGARRRAALAVLAGCAVLAAAAAVLAGRGRPGGLDSAADPRISAALSHVPALLNWLPDFGTLEPAALMTLALALAFVAARRWSGAVLAVAAVPFAAALTDYVLKPHVGAYLGQSFPSGHATVMFALAAGCAILLAGSPRRVPAALRVLAGLGVLLLAGAVALAMVAIQAHTVTDIMAGAAVGTGVVLAGALILDLAARRVLDRAVRRGRPGRAAPPPPAG
jgi:membrane-associated phospholipid phosphatase